MHSSTNKNERVCIPSPHIGMTSPLSAMATFRQNAKALFHAHLPTSLRAKDIVISSDANLHSVVTPVCEIEPFTEEFFPSVSLSGFAGWQNPRCKAGYGIHLIVLGIHAGGRAIKIRFMFRFRHTSRTFRLIVAELCMISASLSPVKTKPAPPMSAAN